MSEEMEFDELESGIVKKMMFVNRKAPYGTIYALESLEVKLISAAFDQDVSVVFTDDGVFDLKKGQDTSATGMKNFSPTYRALEGYDIEKLYVDRESLDTRGLSEEELVVPVEVVSTEQLSNLMEEQEVIFTF